MRGHASHMLMCGAMILGAVVLVLVSGSVLAVIPAVACLLMMVVMMSMMRGGSGGS